ncbi:MAG: proprotein convertase P-domain-containing protein [Candidatus Omnitrophica bacterium]|nr:hypothetical protein [bacterium]NUN95297.1 proprotein convertase P-domain-containing protein [Candidatus Omnitrophota bacterium]
MRFICLSKRVHPLLGALFFLASAPVISAQDIWEPNGTRQLSAVVDFPGNWDPRLAASLDSRAGVADDDWYSYYAPSLSDKWVSLWIEPIENSIIDTEIELYAGNELSPAAANDDIRGGPSAIRTSGIAGASIPQDVTPVAHVFPWNHEEVIQGGYRLNFLRMLAAPAFVDQEVEPNDTFGTANSFSIGNSVNGRIESASDVDWFIVGKAVPRNEDVLVVLQNLSGGGADLQFKVYADNGVTEYSGVGLFGGVGEHDYLRIPFGSHTDDFIRLEIRSLSGSGDYRLFFGTGIAALCPGPYRSAPLATIPDWANGSVGTVSDTIRIPPNSGVISNLRVYIDLSHDYLLDLDLGLEHTATGTKVLLFDNACETSDNISTVFDDAAGTRACPPVHLSATPEQPLAAFNGEQAEGDWRLTVTDVAPGSVGVLNQWRLLIPTPEPTRTPTPSTTASRTPTPTHTRFFDCGSPYTSEPHAAIPDATGSTTGALEDTLIITDNRTITDLDVFVDITHPTNVDLSVSLEYVVTGLTVSLYTSNCAAPSADLSAVFDDEGEPLFCPPVDPSRPVQTDNPFARLNSFDGQNLAGTWKLNIADLGVGNAGTLNKWCLIVTGATATPTVEPTVSPTPTCPNQADLSGDGKVNSVDLIELLRQKAGQPPAFGNADLDCNGVVDDLDLLRFVADWM